MSGDDKILYFPGFEPPERVDMTAPPVPSLPLPRDEQQAAPVPEGAELLTPELRKAVGIVESGMPFLIVGMRPTPGGCDFLSVVVGDPEVVGPAAAHIVEMAGRCLRRAGYQP